MKKIKKQSLQQLFSRRAAASAKLRFQALLLMHSRILQYALVIVGAVVAASLAAWILFGKSSVAVPEQREVRLDTEVADELELSIEERQTTTENPPSIPANVFQ